MNIISFWKKLYKYREMVYSLVRRDLAGRYKRSFLGFLWMMVDPLGQMIIYTVVFTKILPMGIENYYVFLFVALVPWSVFSACLSAGPSIILNQQDMVKKIYFPRAVLPTTFVTGLFINLIFSFTVVFVVLFVSGIGVNPPVLIWLIPVMVIQYVLCLAIVLLVSSLTVYLRDLQMILNLCALALMYAAPVIYPSDRIPDKLQALYFMNPMAVIIDSYRRILYYKQSPNLPYMAQAAAISIICLLIAQIVFSFLERRFGEEL